MVDDFSQCMVSNTRMAARAITRRYDAYARRFGITATQYSLLGLILTTGEKTVTELAEARGFERTTLTRNLDRLEAMELVASHPAERGNGRIPELTEKGAALLTQLLPLWRKAQAEMEADLSGPGFAESLRVLRRLATV